MDENIAEGEEDDHDIIHLLNTKSKNREILSITNAAVDAVSGHQHAKTRTPLVSSGNIKDKEETKENHSITDSFTSTSSKDISFNGRHRVRISSSLLREIKSPLERSDVVNRMASSESGTMSSSSSSTLFASQSSSNQSSVQATGPVPTVIKYSSEPSVEMDMAVVTSHQNTSHRTGTPVVKNSVGYFATGSSGHLHSARAVAVIETDENYQNARTDHGDRDYVKHTRPSESQTEKGTNVSHTESDSKINDNKGIVLSGSNSITKKSTNPHGSVEESKIYLTKAGNKRGRGLCQGAPSSSIVHVIDSEKGQVKAVSFSLSEREKATREMLSKRQESKGVIRRIVQPKLIATRSSDEEQTETQSCNKEKTVSVATSGVSPENVTVDGSASNMPPVQLPNAFEKQMKSLISTMDVIEAQCQESRSWQEHHHQELERNNKQRDERRLQNLEDMQKQLLECQLKNARYVPPMSSQPLPSTSTVTGTTTEELCNTQINPNTQNFQEDRHPWRPQAAGNMNRELMQGVATNNLQYSQAAKHKTQSAFKTSVYSKPSDSSAQSGLKRKFVRNTRTQTSPQKSSSVTCSSSSSEMMSPLDTPLPRKRPPLPMSRDSKTNRESSQKHVHFDTPNVTNTENLVKRREKKTNSKKNLGNSLVSCFESLPATGMTNSKTMNLMVGMTKPI